MAQIKRRKARKNSGSLSVIKRLRARLAAYKSKRKTLKFKSQSMAFGRNRNRGRSRGFRNPFRSRSSFRQRSRRSYGGGGGFSRRVPIIGMKLPSIIIWLAIAGGAIFFGKDYIKPLIDKLRAKL